MGPTLSVFVEDLKQASKTFISTAAEFERHMPKSGFPQPHTGEGALDSMIGLTVHTVGEFHHILAQAIAQHGRKLAIAADRYETNDRDLVTQVESVNAILQDLTTAKYLPPQDYKSPIPD